MFTVIKKHKSQSSLLVLSLYMFFPLVWALISGGIQAHENPGSADDDGPMFVGMHLDSANVVKSFHAALEQGSRDTVSEVLDGRVNVFEGGDVDRSATAYLSGHMNADFEFMAGVETSVLEHRVYESGDMAYSIMRTNYIGRYQGEPVDYIGIETLVLEKRHDSWKVTHIHWSE